MTVNEFLAGLNGKLSYRMFDHWHRTGIIHLTHSGSGSGSRRMVTPAEAAAIRDLVEFNQDLRARQGRLSSGKLYAERLAHHKEQDAA